MQTFRDEQEAAEFMLRHSTSVLAQHRVKFVIVGGWVTYLFNRHQFGHPGTFDVDVLLDSSSLDDGTFDTATEEMLSHGYMRAAKNQFQVHRALSIGGEKVLFHVDFLNERDPGNTLELQTGMGRIKSLYTSPMRVVFKYDRYRHSDELPDVDFASEETFIASKALATLVKKRQRDAFDVYVTVSGIPNLAEFRGRWESLVENDGFFRDANDSLWKAVHLGDASEKVEAILNSLPITTMPQPGEIAAAFDSFLVAPE